MPVIENNLTDSLIALKTQYERSLTEATTNASHLREQLSHVNALLLNHLLPSHGVVPQPVQSELDVPVEAIAPVPATEAPASDSSAQRLHKAKAPAIAKSPAQTEAKQAPAKSRKSFEVLPVYQGMSKREAIAKVLEQHPGEVLHQDTIIQTLYGDLSPEDLKKERVRMDTSLRNGVKANKWKKTPVPASYVLEAIAPTSAAKAKAAKPKLERKLTGAKAKVGRSQKTARPKKTELELVALLRKADIQV
jgi:hypothetical protein